MSEKFLVLNINFLTKKYKVIYEIKTFFTFILIKQNFF